MARAEVPGNGAAPCSWPGWPAARPWRKWWQRPARPGSDRRGGHGRMAPKWDSSPPTAIAPRARRSASSTSSMSNRLPAWWASGEAMIDLVVAWCARRGCAGVDAPALPGSRPPRRSSRTRLRHPTARHAPSASPRRWLTSGRRCALGPIAVDAEQILLIRRGQQPGPGLLVGSRRTGRGRGDPGRSGRPGVAGGNLPGRGVRAACWAGWNASAPAITS